MSDPTPAPTGTKKKDPHFFSVGGAHYSVQLVKANYDKINAVVGLVTTAPAAGTEVQEMSVSSAVKQGFLFPLSVSGESGTKKKRAKIFTARNKIEECFARGGTGLIGKQYGTWEIKDVRPVMKRLITV